MGFPKMNSAMTARVTSIEQSSTPDPPDPPPSEGTNPDGCTIPWTDVCGCESCYVPYAIIADSAMFSVVDSDIPEGFTNWNQLIGRTIEVFLIYQVVTGILHAIAKNRLFVTVQSVVENGRITDQIHVVDTIPLPSPVPVIANELAAGNTTTIMVFNPALYAVGRSIAVTVSVTRRITGVIHAIVGNRLLVTVTAVTIGTYSQSDINVPTIIR
jgi:hypothetical protein